MRVVGLAGAGAVFDGGGVTRVASWTAALGVGVDIRLTVSVTRGDGVGDRLGAASETMLQPATHTLIKAHITSGRQPQYPMRCNIPHYPISIGVIPHYTVNENVWYVRNLANSRGIGRI